MPRRNLTTNIYPLAIGLILLTVSSAMFGIHMMETDKEVFLTTHKFILLVIWSVMVFGACVLWGIQFGSIIKTSTRGLKALKDVSGFSYVALVFSTPILIIEVALGILAWALILIVGLIMILVAVFMAVLRQLGL